MRVTFVAVTRRYQQCQEGVQAQSNAASAIQYKCLAPEHFVPAVSASVCLAAPFLTCSSRVSTLLPLLAALSEHCVPAESARYAAYLHRLDIAEW